MAGLFLAVERPIVLGDNVTVGGNSGAIADITVMHIALDADDRRISIPSATVVRGVLVKHKPGD